MQESLTLVKSCSYSYPFVQLTVIEIFRSAGSIVALQFQLPSERLLQLFYLYQRNIRQPLLNSPTHERILNDVSVHPYFDNCIGALDGCHVAACLRSEDSPCFRNRKGFYSQNVLGVVNFDMMFTYVLAGWEGSAHDGRVLGDALAKGLVTYPNKFYLGDAGYALSENCLTPYRGVRYHLKDWARDGVLAPQNKEELFNLKHSTLRNVVERTFGVCKKRFPVLSSRMNSYPFEIQREW